MQWHTNGPREPLPPGPELKDNFPKGQCVSAPAGSVEAIHGTAPSLVRDLKSTTDRPQLPSLSTIFGYLDHQPPPPPPTLARTEDGSLPAVYQLWQSLAPSGPAPPQASVPSLSGMQFPPNQAPAEPQPQPQPQPARHVHQHHRSQSRSPRTPYQHTLAPSRSQPVTISHHHHHHLHQSHRPPVQQVIPQGPPAPGMAQPQLPHPMAIGKFEPNGMRAIPMYGLGQPSPQPPEPLQVASVSAAPTQKREDLSAEDEQNVAISVYLADSDVVPQLLENGRYQCPLCPRNYKYAKHVRRHIINHTNIYPHSCPRCNALFRRKDAQRRHMQRIHPDIPPHTYMNSRLAPDSDEKSDESR